MFYRKKILNTPCGSALQKDSVQFLTAYGFNTRNTHDVHCNPLLFSAVRDVSKPLKMKNKHQDLYVVLSHASSRLLADLIRVCIQTPFLMYIYTGHITRVEVSSNWHPATCVQGLPKYLHAPLEFRLDDMKILMYSVEKEKYMRQVTTAMFQHACDVCKICKNTWVIGFQ